jgi:hypothetical protein
MVELNRTERAAAAATFMQEENFESHRGAVRWRRSELAEWITAGCPRVRKAVER